MTTFGVAAFAALSNVSNVNPREIDRMMDFALLIADKKKFGLIAKEILEQEICERCLV